jgi:hypothetical protein
MKTTFISDNPVAARIGLELDEFELTALVALVEQGKQRLRGREHSSDIHQAIDLVADQFCSLLAHLELAAADE